MAIKLTVQDLDSRLNQIDAEFSTRGLPLRHRPLESFNAIYGAVPDGPLRASLWEPIALWFIEKYGQKAICESVIGRIPILIRGAAYLIAVPAWSGNTVLNLIDHIEGLPQDIATTFSEEEFSDCGRKVAAMAMEYQTLYNFGLEDPLRDDAEKALAWRGLLDLENSAHSLKHIGDTQTAIFHAHAAAEKFLKIALKRSGSNVPPKSLGHKLGKIFGKLVSRSSRYAWLKAPVDSLLRFAPDMEIRYGVVPRTVQDAVSAFAAALSICGALAQLWIFDNARGTAPATFVPGLFYVDGHGDTYRCKQLSQTLDNRPAAILTRFGIYPGFGGLVMEETRELDVSGLYLEIKDGPQLEKVKKQYEWQMKRLGKELKPQDLGIETTSGAEGIHTTAVIRIRKSNQ